MSCGSRQARKMASVRQTRQPQMCADDVIVPTDELAAFALIQTNCFLRQRRRATTYSRLNLSRRCAALVDDNSASYFDDDNPYSLTRIEFLARCRPSSGRADAAAAMRPASSAKNGLHRATDRGIAGDVTDFRPLDEHL